MRFSNTCNLESAASWHHCARLFASKPRRSAKWAANERPLGSAQQYHYRVVQHADYFDVHLYSQVMARYYKPRPDGKRAVHYTHDSRQTSTQFMDHVLHISPLLKRETTDGRMVLVPVMCRPKLVLDEKNRIVVAESTHAAVQALFANPELTAFKRQFRKDMQWLIDMLKLRRKPDAITGRKRMYATKRADFTRDALTSEDIDALVSMFDWHHRYSEDATAAVTKLLKECLNGMYDRPRPHAYGPPLPLFAETLPSRYRVV